MKYLPTVKNHMISLLILLLAAGKAFASNEPPQKGIFEVLSYKQVVNIELSFDLEAVVSDRRSDTDYPATLNFKDEQGREQSWEIKLNGRGKFRRAKCSEMPPLRLNFKKKDLEAAGLAPFDDLKLVTYCIDDYNTARELVLKEYLAYKMYNEITDASFRVQLLNIIYVDTKTGDKKRQMGFLIEDAAQLRARIGAYKSDEDRVVDAARFDPELRKKTAVFEYLIGNADWEITFSKNIKYVLRDGMILPIPYDFDFSALVSAPYAKYMTTTGQRSFRDRVYLGFERSGSDLQETITFFERKRDDLYRVIQNFKLLSAASRTEMIAYLDTFFETKEAVRFPTTEVAEMTEE